MENMYVDQYTKGEPNWLRDGTVIGADMHTHPSLHKLYFPSFYHLYMHTLHLNI